MKGPVICGIEDDAGAAVAEVARALAERFGLPVLYVHVLGGPGREDEAARLLREAAAPDGGELALEEGHPADRLVELAWKRGASFVVVGNHGPRSSLLGSISADVARRAPCPVVVVPPTIEEATLTEIERELEVEELEIGGGIARFGIPGAAA